MPFYTRLRPRPVSLIVGIHRDFVQVIEGYLVMARRGDRIATRQARLAQTAYGEFMADLTKVAERTAILANEVIPEKFLSSRVGRPPTQGPAHLADALPTSRIIDTGLPAGVVGIVDLEELDKFIYWKAQEYGSDHMVGREIVGFFTTPGRADPDPAQFRTHALFQPAGRGKVAHFQNPIPEGRFIRDGLDVVQKYWSAQMLAAAEDAIQDLRAAAGLARTGRSSRASRIQRFERNFPRLRQARGNVSALRQAIDRL